MKNRRVKVTISMHKKPEEATFLQFGLDTHEDLPGSFTVAVIEFDDGIVDLVTVDNIQFIKEEKPVYEVFDYNIEKVCDYRNPQGLPQFNVLIGHLFCGECKHHKNNDIENKKVTCSYKYDNK